MSKARRGGLLLVLLAALILLWLWLRDGNAAATAAPEQSASRGSEGAALEPVAAAALDPTLLRTTAQDPANSAAALPPADLQDSALIEGRLIFSGGDDYPLPFSRVQVVTDAPVLGEDVPRLGADEFGTKVLSLVPVGEDGRFSFRIPASQGTADVSAVGPGCVATRDVTITIGIPATIPMTFFYLGAIAVRDADSGAPLDAVTNLYFEGAGIGFGTESGATPGVRSSLAYLRIKRQVPREETPSTYPQWYTSSKHYEQGLPFRVHARVPGFDPFEAAVLMPGYSGEMPIRLVALPSGVKVRYDVVLTIVRPGDWSGTESCEYSGTGRFSIRSDQPDVDQLGAYSPLRPDLLTLRGIPFAEPRLWFEAEYVGRTRDSPKPYEIPLTHSPAPGGPYTAELAISDLAAFYVPPRMDSAGESAYFGHIRHSDGKPGWRRYSVRKGLILDGLRPDRYRVFWAESYPDFNKRMAENLPFADLTLVPGLNRLPAPQ